MEKIRLYFAPLLALRFSFRRYFPRFEPKGRSIMRRRQWVAELLEDVRKAEDLVVITCDKCFIDLADMQEQDDLRAILAEKQEKTPPVEVIVVLNEPEHISEFLKAEADKGTIVVKAARVPLPPGRVVLDEKQSKLITVAHDYDKPTQYPALWGPGATVHVWECSEYYSVAAAIEFLNQVSRNVLDLDVPDKAHLASRIA